MEPVTPVLDRVVAKPWAAAVLLAALTIGVSGTVDSLGVYLFFYAPEMGAFADLFGDVLRSQWGFVLGYLGLAVAAGLVLHAGRRSGVLHDWWQLVWRTVVVMVPTSIVVTFVFSLVAALIQGYPFHVLGLRILG